MIKIQRMRGALIFLSIMCAAALIMHYTVGSSPVTIYVQRLPSGHLFISEDPFHPRLQHFRNSEKIDDIIAGSATDIDRLTALALWTSRLFEPTSPFPHYPPWDAAAILSRIRKKETGGFCAQYAIIFGQACQSLGYAVRYIDLASKDSRSGHFNTEVFVPSENKWIVFEPQFGFTYHDGKGTYLNALDIHRRIVDNQRDIFKYPGKNKRVGKNRLDLFYHFRFYLRNNFISVPVYYQSKQHAQGRQWIFEPYRLRWVDTYTAGAPESFKSFESSDEEDFIFPFEKSMDKAVLCGSVQQFFKIMNADSNKQASYKLLISRKNLRKVIEGLVDTTGFSQYTALQ